MFTISIDPSLRNAQSINIMNDITYENQLNERPSSSFKLITPIPWVGMATSNTFLPFISCNFASKCLALPVTITCGISSITSWSYMQGQVLRLNGEVGQQCENFIRFSSTCTSVSASEQFFMKSTTFSPHVIWIFIPFQTVNNCGSEQSAMDLLDSGKKLPLQGCKGYNLLLSKVEEGMMKTSTVLLSLRITLAIQLMESIFSSIPPMITTAVMDGISSLQDFDSSSAKAKHCQDVGQERISIFLSLRETPSLFTQSFIYALCRGNSGRQMCLAANLLECFLNFPSRTTCTPNGRSVATTFRSPIPQSTKLIFNFPLWSSISSSSSSSQMGYVLLYFS